MSIEKMEFVNIAGLTSELDPVLDILSECGCFHMEPASNHSSSDGGYGTLKEENPYVSILRLLGEISSAAKIKYEGADYSDIENTDMRKHERHLNALKNRLNGLIADRKAAEEKLKAYEKALEQVNHLTGLDIDMQKIFSCEYIKVRFGRLPADSYEKLPYYEDKLFYFTPFTQEEEYYWGFFFTPVSCAAETDEIFDSLYFERMRIADFVHGNTEDALTELSAMIDENRANFENYIQEINSVVEKEKPFLDKLFSLYKSQHDTFDLRRMVAVMEDKFHIIGFVPKSESERFMDLFDEMESVSVLMQPADANGKLQPPVKLKNNKFTQPFSMFVEMYGLPSYNGINPTAFVAVTYTLLFGIMFGDVGQGLVLAIAGALLWKFKKIALGPILTRVGISGAVFGLLYGSVFGYEELLDPVYESLGITFLPFKIMHNVAPILVAAIAIGVLIMLISIMINIVMGIKNKHYAEALFGNNGIAGLMFFGSILFGAVGTLLGMKIFSPVYVAVFIILPLIMMFLREPLANWVRGKKYEAEGGIVDFIASNFFEVFEFLLGYATNTLSFVRIGGFVLSHASMMLVVMALAEQVSAAAVPIVIVIGNIFVMGIEGLLVGIQTLRLEFYEIFSRFYSGDGRPFTPVKINYDENIE
ncbi:MAG: ATPase [Oscillospiraceae bacterium]|nr:ATPase [Oscillospiraceae bacterium]